MYSNIDSTFIKKTTHSCRHHKHANSRMMKPKKRAHNKQSLGFTFSYLMDREDQVPPFVICQTTLAIKSMKPHQLRQHLNNVHPEHAGKERAFFENKEKQLRRVRVDSSGTIKQRASSTSQVSYAVTYFIAKVKKTQY